MRNTTCSSDPAGIVRTITASNHSHVVSATLTLAVVARKSSASASWPAAAAARSKSWTCQPVPPDKMAKRIVTPRKKTS